ncbi:MAG: phosphatase PAP2 family protein [Candidatus Nealsonbacteria bacterium]|nr:phosphatase PAP2 family protein [Candidatus Nealsonbacteria bacterium]
MINPDFIFFGAINQFAGKFTPLDYFSVFISEYFGYIILAIFIFLFLFNIEKYLSMFIVGVLSSFIARFGAVELIRFFLPKTRPFIENNVNLLVDRVNQSSFPSGHAAFFFALAASVYFYNKKTGLLFFAGGLLVSLARVFVGLHWPSDVLAGAILGIATALILRPLFGLTKQKDHF